MKSTLASITFGLLIAILSYSVFAQTLDMGFGVDGTRIFPFPFANPGAPIESSVDGWIHESESQSNYVLFRYSQTSVKSGTSAKGVAIAKVHQNGMYDTSYGTNGLKWQGGIGVNRIVKSPENRVLAAGWKYPPGDSQTKLGWKLFLYDQNLDFVEGFGTKGVAEIDFVGIDESVTDVAILPSGKVIATGLVRIGSGEKLTVVARLNADGTLDNTFGPYGKGFTDVWDGGASSERLAVDSAGAIYVAGNTPVFSGNEDLYVLKLTPDGILDTEFANNGTFTRDSGGDDDLIDLVIGEDGKVFLLADVTNTDSSQTWELNSLNGDGTYNQTFGNAGQIKRSFSFGGQGVVDLGLSPKGRLIVTGYGFLPYRSSGTRVLQRDYFLRVSEYDQAGRQTGTNMTRYTSPLNVIDLPFEYNLGRFGNSAYHDDGRSIVNGGGFTSQLNLATTVGYSEIFVEPFKSPFLDFRNEGRSAISNIRTTSSGDLQWWSVPESSKLLGQKGDIPVPGDYDGDHTASLAVFRPSTGNWIVSTRNYDDCIGGECLESFKWGFEGDIPVPGDFDGDGITDRTVFRPSNGVWYVNQSSGGILFFQFGQAGDLPVISDFDGDNIDDFSVVRNQNGQLVWYSVLSGIESLRVFVFGLSSDYLVPGDYDGNGKSEVAVFRPESASWWILNPEGNVRVETFGETESTPIALDYDNDGILDLGTYKNGVHVIRKSTNDEVLVVPFGIEGDYPVAAVRASRFEE